ncbi:MAG: KOW motif-containing protein [Bacteroidaceae bacterium]|nr:KOW motif-containing protein [Bacteroidaceae bacterium]
MGVREFVTYNGEAVRSRQKQGTLSSTDTNWYAVKIYTGKAAIAKYLYSQGIEMYSPVVGGQVLFPELTFLRCKLEEIQKIKEDWSRNLVLYRTDDRKSPLVIPDAEMENFQTVLQIEGKEFIPLDIYDKTFLEGPTVRVLDGPFKGVIGVVKRIKGDRRLIVSVAGIAAVATEYVPQEYLEKI